MKNILLLEGLIVLLVGANQAIAQTSSFAPIPPDQTIQAKQWHQIAGCGCGIDKNSPESFRKQMTVSPLKVGTTTGKQVQIRYDASTICNGQGIHDTNGVDISQGNFAGVGTLTWEPGVIQTLPSTAGIVTFTGYQQAKSDSISVNIKLQCFDSGAKCTAPGHFTVCSANATIPVDVTKRKKAKAK
jgi:hypothetical protein